MSTNADYIEFVMDCVGRIQGNMFRVKKMFGDYCLYCDEIPVALVCDNSVYVKRLKFLEPLMGQAATGVPYEGAKEQYILDIEDFDLAEKVFWMITQERNKHQG